MMKKTFLGIACAMMSMAGMYAQGLVDISTVPEYTTYTDATNPVKATGNNMLQGASFTEWLGDSGWGTIGGGPYASYDGNRFTTGKISYTAPAGVGNFQWAAQLRLTTNYSIVQGNRYDLTFHVKSTAANKFTVKVEDPDSNGSKSIYSSYVTLPANKEVLFVLHNYEAKTTLDVASIVFDAGGAETGSTIEIYDIVLQGELTGAAGGPMELAAVPEGYELVWSDEFDQNTLTSKWNQMTWNKGRVNNELQNYRPGSQDIVAADGTTRHTAEIKDGKLIITCFKGSDGKIYSARMDSHDATGNHGGYAAWRYGYVEARIKLPSGKGTWPAFWMMPEGVNWTDENWPRCGEIDIMEEVGNDPNNAVSSLHAEGHYHANGTQVSSSRHVDNMEGGWITYAMLWDNDNISMYADGKRVLSYSNDHNGYLNWPYDRPYYVTLNLAWGGDWGGAGGVDEKALPLNMEVDYVRVYQLPVTDKLNADGSGVVYVSGPYNGVAKDGVVPSSTFNSWNDNYFAIEVDNKVFTKKFKIGKNLHASRGHFKFFATSDCDPAKAFTPNGGTYRATMLANDYLDMDENGLIKPKSGLHNNDILTVTLDCSKGIDNATISVSCEVGEIEKVDYYLIGAKNSIWPEFIGTNDTGWDWKYYYTLEQDGYVHSHTFEVGKDIDPNWVNFKFMPQNSWSGGQFGSNNEWAGYTIHYDGEMFKIGTGKNGADNGNVVLADGKSLDGIKEFKACLDVTNGNENAMFYAIFDGVAETSTGVDSITEEDENAMWFDLTGRMISKPMQPGLYIHGNKKVVIK